MYFQPKGAATSKEWETPLSHVKETLLPKNQPACPTCAGEHKQESCTVKNKSEFKCVSCKLNHKASSITLEYYTQAFLISAELQYKNITQEQAFYAQMYENVEDRAISQNICSTPLKTSLIQRVVFQSQPTLSQNNFPEINPSPIIRTKKIGPPHYPNFLTV